MKSPNIRSAALPAVGWPSSLSALSIIRRAPPPIMSRAMAGGTTGSPSRANTTFRLSIKSGAVSTSVPSRSKTTVSAAMFSAILEGVNAGKRPHLIADVYFTKFMDIEAQKRQAAAVAVEWVRPGMRLGLGTGSTAKHFVELLAERVRGGLDVVGVPTSDATRADAERLGVPLTTLDDTPELDMTVDGADEVSADLTLIKGGGGALLREKIVAAASARMVVVSDESKAVPVLGRFPLPIEVIPFGLASTRKAIEAAFAAACCAGPLAVRTGKDGHAFVTDGGHWILDASLGRIPNPKMLADRLVAIPGVVEHDLFIGMAHAAILAGSGGIRVLERS